MGDKSGLGAAPQDLDGSWARGGSYGRLERACSPARPASADLSEREAVKHHGEGISTDDFVSFHEAFTDYSASRIRGVGQKQYFDGQRQRFEVFSGAELIDETLDELADVVNYAVMLGVKLLALREKVA